MSDFGNRLRSRAKQLGLPDAEVARRAGLAPRRYGFYVTGDRQPDFGTLITICAALDTTPNALLGFGEIDVSDERTVLQARLLASAKLLSEPNLKLAIEQVELLLKHQ